MSESVLLRASPVRPCFPGPAKRRLGPRELGYDCGPGVHPFSTIPTCSSAHDALVYRFMETTKEKGRKIGKENEASVAPLGPEGWKDIL